MIDVESLHNKIFYLMVNSDKCIKKALSNKLFLRFFENDEMSFFIAREFSRWYKQYKTVPSLRQIHEKHKSSEYGGKLQIRIKVIVDMSSSSEPPLETEFESYINDLKLIWLKTKFSEKMENYTVVDPSKMKEVNIYAKTIKDFGNEFVKISSDATMEDEGEYSNTTSEAPENIEKIKNKDISTEKRFKIGHRILDNATNGFRYGDVMMILGNVNTGKSMVVTNVAYNLWKDGANILLLTCEMKPEEFDERIYSRATAVRYDAILNGKNYLNEEDLAALDEYGGVMARSEHKIITKFLRATDNVATVEGYIEDLKLKSNFIPDVLIVDSLEHISPLHPNAEGKDNLIVGQVIKEFKDFAQTFMSNRGLVIISTHQAKTETHDKKFEEISIVDFGRTKEAAAKPDFSIYIRSLPEANTMNVKLIKARRTAAGTTWTMAVDFSKALVADTEDATNTALMSDD